MAAAVKTTGPSPEIEAQKEKSQFVYSLILIFLIPVAMIANTFLNVGKTQKTLNSTFESGAKEIAAVFASGIDDNLDDVATINQKINKTLDENSAIKEIAVLKPIDEGFEVIASSNASDQGIVFSSLQYTTAWLENQTIATILSEKDPPADEVRQSQRFWLVIAPFQNLAGEKAALVSLKYSLANADTLAQKNLLQTLIILGITIFFVLLLLFNHFQFFQYAILFRRLKEVDKMKDDFISMSSHELKTPMAAMKGYMGMIFEGVAGQVDEKAREHLDKVMANIRRLDGLVDALLDVSKLEQQRMQFDMQAIDLSQIISAIISEIKVQADEKKLTLEYQPISEPRPVVFVDPDRVAQVFENVIGNAIKYTFKGGVTISHQIEGGRLKTLIADTGVGMSSEDMKGLFSKFHRIRTEKTIDIPGTGLGLWISREIVLRMNGDIYATSKENLGSTFTIVFPIMKATKKWKKFSI